MALLDPLNNYCERLGPGLFAEPLNAISNAAFFIAAYMLYKTWKSYGSDDRQSGILIGLIALVGTGSTLFHTFANRLTMLGDVIPIGMFTFYYLWVVLRRQVGTSKMEAVYCLAGFVVAAAMVGDVPKEHSFNGSVSYFPCLGAVLLIGWTLKRKKHWAAKYLIKAGLLFAVSLAFRSVDYMVCPHFAFGTHFIWHTLNGFVLYFLTKGVMKPSLRVIH